MKRYSRLSGFVLTLVFQFSIGINHSTAMVNPADWPSCDSLSADPDGDGFGWIVSNQSSCLVTSETDPVPEYINRETGQPVLLERAYWDANADLTDRNISCQRFEWNDASSTYAVRDTRWYRFVALPNETPWIAHYYSKASEAELNTNDRPQFIWSVDFGIFSNEFSGGVYTPDSFPAGETHWIEPVLVSGAQEALRFWDDSRLTFDNGGNIVPDIRFTECIDSSGEPLRTTGRWDQPATNQELAYIDTPLFFTGKQEPEPAITDRKNGRSIQLDTGTWEFQQDLVYRTVTCSPYRWQEGINDYAPANDFLGRWKYEYHPRLLGGAVNSSWAWGFFDGNNFVDDWSVTENSFIVPESTFANSMWFEQVTDDDSGTQGVRYWGVPGEPADVRNQSYQDCYATERTRGLNSNSALVASFKPTGSCEDCNADSSVDPDGTPISDTDTDSDTTAETISSSSSVSGGGAISGLYLLLMVLVSNTLRRMRSKRSNSQKQLLRTKQHSGRRCL